MCQLKNLSPVERLKSAVECSRNAVYDIERLETLEEKYGLDLSEQKTAIANAVLGKTIEALGTAA